MKIEKLENGLYGLSKESYMQAFKGIAEKADGIPECYGKMTAIIELPRQPQVEANTAEDAKAKIKEIIEEETKKLNIQMNRYVHCVKKCEYRIKCYKTSLLDSLRRIS